MARRRVARFGLFAQADQREQAANQKKTSRQASLSYLCCSDSFRAHAAPYPIFLTCTIHPATAGATSTPHPPPHAPTNTLTQARARARTWTTTNPPLQASHPNASQTPSTCPTPHALSLTPTHTHTPSTRPSSHANLGNPEKLRPSPRSDQLHAQPHTLMSRTLANMPDSKLHTHIRFPRHYFYVGITNKAA
jgi:hypothetical protein